MKISDALALASALTGQTPDTATAVGWLSEYDGKLAYEFFRAETWTPYDPTDLTTELLLPYPWDGAYLHYLEAMLYYDKKEMDRYQCASTMADKKLSDYREYMRRTKSAPCTPGFPIPN